MFPLCSGSPLMNKYKTVFEVMQSAATSHHIHYKMQLYEMGIAKTMIKKSLAMLGQSELEIKASNPSLTTEKDIHNLYGIQGHLRCAYDISNVLVKCIFHAGCCLRLILISVSTIS